MLGYLYGRLSLNLLNRFEFIIQGCFEHEGLNIT